MQQIGVMRALKVKRVALMPCCRLNIKKLPYIYGSFFIIRLYLVSIKHGLVFPALISQLLQPEDFYVVPF